MLVIDRVFTDFMTTKTQGHEAFEGTVYYRQRGVLVLAPTFIAERGDRTHLRPSIRFMLGCSGDFELEFEDGRVVQSRAALLLPNVGLCAIRARNSDFALFDFAVASAEYKATDPLLRASPLVHWDIAPFEKMLPQLISGQNGGLDCREVVELVTEVVETLTGAPLQPLQLDERIMRSLQLIETLPLAEIKLAVLAKHANLSPDRFRHLFKDATGSTVSQYARTTAVWRALALLQDKTTITEASHAAGFHDVSHFYHVYSDMFGISLSEKRNIRKFRRVRCFE